MYGVMDFHHLYLSFGVLLLAGIIQVNGQPLLDLNAPDSTTINITAEYFDMDQVIFLSNMTEYMTPNGDWSSVYLLIMQGETGINEDVDVYTQVAFDAGRTDDDYTGLFTRTPLLPGDSSLNGFDIDASLVTHGMLVEVNINHIASNGSTLMNEFIIGIALNSSGFITRIHPGYGPREVCIIADDMMDNTTACLTLFFIGYNDDRPVVTYEPFSNITFTEGLTEYIPIIAGDLNITDQDHPTRYLMMSAQAQIEEYQIGYPEFLHVSYELLNFTYDYDTDTGVLTISGAATTEEYQLALSYLTYFNNMTEPLGDSRSISITVFDGKFSSEPVSVLIIINNTNDAPAISLNGEVDPVNQLLQTSYTEGTGAQQIVPLLQVVDTDPTALIRRVTVNLTNPIDGFDEEISISTSRMGLTISPSSPSHFIEISGLATTELFTEVLRSLTYQHLDVGPGNPSVSQPRILVFYIEDDQNVANLQSSVLELTIFPINDPPILFFVSNSSLRASIDPVLMAATEMRFEYIEDDPALNFGRDIYLRDVDGNISHITLNLRNLLNGDQDHVYVNSTLLDMYAVDLDISRETGMSRVLVLNATNYEGTTPMAFEEILRSVRYINLLMDNRVTDGQRSITIVTTDADGAESAPIIAYIRVADRNDGPVVNVGGGESMDFMVTFVENGPSIPIAFSHLIDIVDEEMHNISRLTVELISTNGNLDPTDSIFLRSPMSLPFIDNFASPPTTTFIDITLNSSVSAYEEALRAVYFDNSEIEPTIFNANGANLTRIIVINITDANFADLAVDRNDIFNADLGTTMTTIRIGINIQPINDNRPRIRLLAIPEGCATNLDSVTDLEASMDRRRREIRAASRFRKRNIQGEHNIDKGPRLISSHAYLSKVSGSLMCVKNITLTFNVNTSAPVVEVPTKLNNIISFNQQDLENAPKFGRWMDYRTLTIVFVECTVWNRMTTRKQRPISVIFEASRGDCDWSSPCTIGVCFANDTGCPVSGTHLLKHTETDETISNEGESENHDWKQGYPPFVTALLAFAGMIIAVIFGCAVIRRQRSLSWNSKKSTKSLSIEDTVVTVTHKQQREINDSLTQIQDLYPPTTLVKLPKSLQVGAATTNHETIKTFPSNSSIPPPLALLQQHSSTISTTADKSSKSPVLTVNTNSELLSTCTVQDINASREQAAKCRTTGGRSMDTEPTPETGEKEHKQQSASKRKKKRAKTTPSKAVDDHSKGDKIELRSPLSEDICNWLQLNTSERNECDKELQQSCDQSCYQSHNQQPSAGDKHSYYDRTETDHHNTILAEENKIVAQRTNLQTTFGQTS